MDAVIVGADILARTECRAPGTMGETFDLLAEEGMLDGEYA